MSFFGCGSNTINPFVRHLWKYIGQTVSIYTVGGDGIHNPFTGTLLHVNSEYATLGFLPPPCPFPQVQIMAQGKKTRRDKHEEIQKEKNDTFDIPADTEYTNPNNKIIPEMHPIRNNEIDIPIDKIVAVFHKAG